MYVNFFLLAAANTFASKIILALTSHLRSSSLTKRTLSFYFPTSSTSLQYRPSHGQNLVQSPTKQCRTCPPACSCHNSGIVGKLEPITCCNSNIPNCLYLDLLQLTLHKPNLFAQPKILSFRKALSCSNIGVNSRLFATPTSSLLRRVTLTTESLFQNERHVHLAHGMAICKCHLAHFARHDHLRHLKSSNTPIAFRGSFVDDARCAARFFDRRLGTCSWIVGSQMYVMQLAVQMQTCVSPQSSRKSTTTSHGQSCPASSMAQHSLLCSYSSQPNEASLAEQELVHSGLIGQPCLHMSPKSGN